MESSNEFQTVESGQGLLKQFYDDDRQKKSLEDALKRRREKLASTKLGLEPTLGGG